MKILLILLQALRVCRRAADPDRLPAHYVSDEILDLLPIRRVWDVPNLKHVCWNMPPTQVLPDGLCDICTQGVL